MWPFPSNTALYGTEEDPIGVHSPAKVISAMRVHDEEGEDADHVSSPDSPYTIYPPDEDMAYSSHLPWSAMSLSIVSDGLNGSSDPSSNQPRKRNPVPPYERETEGRFPTISPSGISIASGTSLRRAVLSSDAGRSYENTILFASFQIAWSVMLLLIGVEKLKREVPSRLQPMNAYPAFSGF